MEGDNLMCNFKKCRKSLFSFAYVTACSHVFCDEDGTREFNKSHTCPACQTSLTSKFEIVRNNLQPSEQYKSMILAGLNPETISEICGRALSFWVYQMHQEMTYQGHTATKAKERAQQLEQYYEQIVARTTTELSSSKKELEETKKKYNDVSEKLLERNRQHQKLQSMYDTLRRKFITVNSNLDGRGDAPSNHQPRSIPNLAGSNNNIPDLFAKSSSNDDGILMSPSRFEFNPRPSNEPIHDMNFDQPANRVQKRFSVSLGTPRQ